MFELIFVLTSLLPVAFGDDPCCEFKTACACCKFCECPQAYADVLVKRVIDGDTIEIVRKGGEPTRVRLIGVDTPETVDRKRGKQKFGPEASAFTKELLEGRRVRLQFEQKRLDSFGRIVAYLYLNDELVNLRLVREGYGRCYTKFKFARRKEFDAAEADAKLNKRGIWKDDLRQVGSVRDSRLQSEFADER